jgi:NADP-dependent 3-hydroxy acid dehydrogenase YdfG
VVLAARNIENLEKVREECGKDRAIAVECDVTQRSQHINLLEKAIVKFGRVDVWVNNAGVGISKPILEVTDEDFDAMMTFNVKSVLYGMQTVVPYFKEQKSGVINVSSLLGRVSYIYMYLCDMQ